jgi:hypothetical protein
LLQDPARGSLAEFVDIAPNLIQDAIHRFRNAIRSVSCHVFAQGTAVELATGGPELVGEAFGLFKYVIGD